MEGRSTNSGIIGPLKFSDEFISSAKLKPAVEIPCLFCEKKFMFYSRKHDYLSHLYIEHRLVIGDEEQIAILHEYLIYWRKIFDGKETTKSKFCTTIFMDQLPDGKPSENEKYYLLCDVLKQDYELRNNLNRKRMEIVLAQHQFERTDESFERNCLFCRESIKTRFKFVDHLHEKHFLRLGKSENLVFIDELIDALQFQLDSLKCLFCGKKFKDRTTLKEHMRKKGHKRISPNNKEYDRFYIKNYTKPNEKKNENNYYFERDSSDSNWSDWEDDEQNIMCLFCKNEQKDFLKLTEHMTMEHGIDFKRETAENSFYDRIKMVNYVRRSMFMLKCIRCKRVFPHRHDLQTHLKDEFHYTLGERKEWDMPQYYFPTYEDDGFLQHLDDTDFDDDNTQNGSITIHAEDITV